MAPTVYGRPADDRQHIERGHVRPEDGVPSAHRGLHNRGAPHEVAQVPHIHAGFQLPVVADVARAKDGAVRCFEEYVVLQQAPFSPVAAADCGDGKERTE